MGEGCDGGSTVGEENACSVVRGAGGDVGGLDGWDTVTVVGHIEGMDYISGWDGRTPGPDATDVDIVTDDGNGMMKVVAYVGGWMAVLLVVQEQKRHAMQWQANNTMTMTRTFTGNIHTGKQHNVRRSGPLISHCSTYHCLFYIPKSELSVEGCSHLKFLMYEFYHQYIHRNAYTRTHTYTHTAVYNIPVITVARIDITRCTCNSDFYYDVHTSIIIYSTFLRVNSSISQYCSRILNNEYSNWPYHPLWNRF